MHSMNEIKNIKEKLLNYQKSFWFEKEKEEEVLKTFLNFIENESDHFNRENTKGHFTASCWLWNFDESMCLLTHHKKFDQWIQLGGHADQNPDLLEVALKEAQEESGIKNIIPLSTEIFHIAHHSFIQKEDQKPHEHYDVCFILKALNDEPFRISKESKNLKWIKPIEFENYTQDAHVFWMRNKILNARSSDLENRLSIK